jgi:hypothetical protein
MKTQFDKYGNNNNNNNNTSCREPGHRKEESVKVNLQDMGCRRVDWTNNSGHGSVVGTRQ